MQFGNVTWQNPGGTGPGANVPAGFYNGLASGISSGGMDTGSGQAATPFNGGSMGVSAQQIQDQNASVAANQAAAMGAGFGNYGAGGGHQVTQADFQPGGNFWGPAGGTQVQQGQQPTMMQYGSQPQPQSMQGSMGQAGQSPSMAQTMGGQQSQSQMGMQQGQMGMARNFLNRMQPGGQQGQPMMQGQQPGGQQSGGAMAFQNLLSRLRGRNNPMAGAVAGGGSQAPTMSGNAPSY